MSPESNSITAIQSATIQAALKAIGLNLAYLITVLTGHAYNVEFIQMLVEHGGGALINLATIYYSLRAIQARINATSTIKKGKS